MNVARTKAHRVGIFLAKYSVDLRELIATHLFVEDRDVAELTRRCRRISRLVYPTLQSFSILVRGGNLEKSRSGRGEGGGEPLKHLPLHQDLGHSHITDECMQHLCSLANLTHLDINSCRHVTAKTVSLLQTTHGPILTNLVLSHGMVKLAGLNWEFPKLVRLEVAQYFQANDGILYALARNCASLEKLVLAGCHSICTDGIYSCYVTSSIFLT